MANVAAWIKKTESFTLSSPKKKEIHLPGEENQMKSVRVELNAEQTR